MQKKHNVGLVLAYFPAVFWPLILWPGLGIGKSFTSVLETITAILVSSRVFVIELKPVRHRQTDRRTDGRTDKTRNVAY